ncbi:MAG: MBL fold metallo-hydrolase [Promethearchaeota archaeon]
MDSGKVNDYLHHVDLRAYGSRRILSVYIAEFEEGTLIFDTGSSLDTKKLMRYLKKSEIELSSVKYIIPSHGHFDHNGGTWQFIELIKNYSPEIKILASNAMMGLLNDFQYHLDRARRTYGNFVGEMKPIPPEYFKIITPFENPERLEILEKFHVNGIELGLAILSTPGHTHDHQCPLFIKENGEVEFMFFGEAVGTLYHSTKLLTMPTSMPVLYNHKKYMNSLRKIKQFKPIMGGFGHFGLIKGRDSVKEIIEENEAFTELFRKKVMEYYQEKPETRYVVEKITPLLMERSDIARDNDSTFKGIILGLVYGMLMDLGYRKE